MSVKSDGAGRIHFPRIGEVWTETATGLSTFVVATVGQSVQWVQVLVNEDGLFTDLNHGNATSYDWITKFEFAPEGWLSNKQPPVEVTDPVGPLDSEGFDFDDDPEDGDDESAGVI